MDVGLQQLKHLVIAVDEKHAASRKLTAKSRANPSIACALGKQYSM
jgi:hypothetical protein